MEIDANFNQTLQNWLHTHWHGVDEVRVHEGISQPAGSGFSASTLIVPVSYQRDAQRIEDRIVVRMESDEEAVYPQQTDHFDIEIELQYRSIHTLLNYPEVPVAPLIGFEKDASILGAPFFVMGFVDGQVPIENPIYTAEGFFVEASPEQRATMIRSGLQTLARIHLIDWREAGVEWLLDGEPSVLKQIDLWQAYTERELAGRVHPAIDKAYVWLREQLAKGDVEATHLGLCWGDARPGNIIWQHFNCACVCDFENIAVGPAEMDLGWWLMFDRYAHEAQGIERLPGEPTREEQKAFYEQCVSRTVGDTWFYELFAAVRYAALVVRVMNRWVANGDLPEDQTIWLENPVADMLAVMIENHA